MKTEGGAEPRTNALRHFFALGRQAGNAAFEFIEAHPWRFCVRLLQGLTLATLLIGAIGMARSGFSERAVREYSSGKIAEANLVGTEESNNRPAEFYLRAVRGKKLFRTLREEVRAPVAAKPDVPAAPPVPVKTLAELAEDLMLVGVAESDQPQAIIVNKKSQKTYYLSAGQRIGEIRILSVQQDRVVLGFNDETLDLAM